MSSHSNYSKFFLYSPKHSWHTVKLLLQLVVHHILIYWSSLILPEWSYEDSHWTSEQMWYVYLPQTYHVILHITSDLLNNVLATANLCMSIPGHTGIYRNFFCWWLGSTVYFWFYVIGPFSQVLSHIQLIYL